MEARTKELPVGSPPLAGERGAEQSERPETLGLLSPLETTLIASMATSEAIVHALIHDDDVDFEALYVKQKAIAADPEYHTWLAEQDDRMVVDVEDPELREAAVEDQRNLWDWQYTCRFDGIEDES